MNGLLLSWLLLAAGAVLLTVAAAILHPAAGFATAGTACIAVALLAVDVDGEG